MAEKKAKAPKGDSRQENKRSSESSGFEKQQKKRSRVAFLSDNPYALPQRVDVDLKTEQQEA